jgi:hypothetical protein
MTHENHPDATLIALVAKFQQAHRDFVASLDEYEQDRTDELLYAQADLTHEIALLPATTLEGLIAKATVAEVQRDQPARGNTFEEYAEKVRECEGVSAAMVGLFIARDLLRLKAAGGLK